jgi:hypothetical protein
MGWRDVQAGVASGAISYAPDEFKEGFARMGKNIVKRMNAHTDAKIQAKLDAEAEAAAERKELKKLQDAAEQEDQERREQVKTMLSSLGLDPNDTKLAAATFGKLKAFGAYDKTLDWLTGKVKADGLIFADPPENAQTNSMLGGSSEFNLADYSDLARSESSNDPTDTRTNEDGEIYSGKWQFGDERLAEVNAAMGTNFTAKTFNTTSEKIQDEVASWHFKDILQYIEDNDLDSYIGKEINGVRLTERSLVAVAHLGGRGGLKKFLQTNGKYNPPDELGTTLLKYAKAFSGEASGGFTGFTTPVADDKDAETLPNYMTALINKNNITGIKSAVDQQLQQFSDPENVPPEKQDEYASLIARQSLIVSVEKSYEAAAANPTIKLTDKNFSVTLNNEAEETDGDETTTQPKVYTAILTDEGKYFVNGAVYNAGELTVLQDLNAVQDANIIANRVTNDVTNPLLKIRTDTGVVLRTAKQLDDFVLNNPSILTEVGGPVSAFLVRIGNNLSAVARTITNVSPEEFEKRMGAEFNKLLNKEVSDQQSVLGSNASAYSQWASLNYKYAFAYAKLALDSSGQALSNMDFKNSLTINTAGSDYPTYTANMRSNVIALLDKKKDEYADLKDNNIELITGLLHPLVKSAWEQTGLSTDLIDYYTQKLPDQMAWAKATDYTPTDLSGGGGDTGGGTTDTLNPEQSFNEFFNDTERLQEDFSKYDRLLNAPALRPEKRDSFLNTFFDLRATRVFGQNYTADQLSRLKDLFKQEFEQSRRTN